MKRQKRKKQKYISKKKVELISNDTQENNMSTLMKILEKFYDDIKEPPQTYSIPNLYGIQKIEKNFLWGEINYNDTSTKPTDIKIVKPKKNLKRNIIL